MRRYSEFGVAKKKTAKKKTSSRKKASATSATASRRKKVTKKAASKKKTTAKKAASKKKTAAKKTTSKKKTASKKKAESKKGTDNKAEAAPTRRKRRQTVVEAVLASETDSRGFVMINGRRIRRISAEASKKTRKRSSSAVDSAKAKKAADDKPVKTKLTKQELTHFRDLLISKRKELLAAVDSMEFEALRSDDGDTSSMPIHMADVGSDAYEQDLMLGMAASERQRIRDIDDALKRIQNSTYGVCELTRKPISKKRLNAKPWAKYTIDSARKIERGL